MRYESVCLHGEKSIEDEIRGLQIPQEDKERILKKLKEIDCNMEKEIAKTKNQCCAEVERVSKPIENIKEQNIALKNACFALSEALKQEENII